MMQAPAPIPVNQRDGHAYVKPPKMRKTGLLPIKSGAMFNLTIGDKIIGVYARSSDDATDRECHYVCLHEKCAGKRWASEAEMRRDHPSSTDMAKRDEPHCYGLWCDEPLSHDAVDSAAEAYDAAEQRAQRVEKGLAPVDDDDYDSDANERKRERAKKMRKEADDAKQAALLAAAPIGLIAPPEAMASDVEDPR